MMETKRIYTNTAFVIEISPVDQQGVHVTIETLLGSTRAEFDLNVDASVSLAHALLAAAGDQKQPSVDETAK